MKHPKHWLVVIFLSATLVYSFLLPPHSNQSPEFISGLHIPLDINTWHGQNISESALNLEEQQYNFINGYFAAAYYDEKTKRDLTFSIIDSDHFHYPKVCYTGAGFDIRELNGEIEVKNQKLQANALYAWNKDSGLLTLYWICLNKKIVGISRQITNQLIASLFNKKNISLMVRIDLPAAEDNMDESKMLIKQFLEDLFEKISPNDREYLFGEK
jgi:hypothetical protein